jgi:hypothetical protein
LSFTRGARIRTVPDPTVTPGSRARPLRTTSRLPRSSTSSTNDATYTSTSASSAAAIIRRAPSPARSSSVTAISSPSPTGEPANILHGVPSCRPSPASVFINREGTPPSSSTPSTTSGYSSCEPEQVEFVASKFLLRNRKLRAQRRAIWLTGSEKGRGHANGARRSRREQRSAACPRGRRGSTLSDLASEAAVDGLLGVYASRLGLVDWKERYLDGEPPSAQ